jgi:hypothetical protein
MDRARTPTLHRQDGTDTATRTDTVADCLEHSTMTCSQNLMTYRYPYP